MWRLVGIILILAVLLAFIGFNLDNKSDISFGFAKLTEVPVYLTLFASFVLGMLASVPFLVSFTLRKRKPGKRGGKGDAAAAPAAVASKAADESAAPDSK